MKAIICQNAAGYIGDKGELMWHCPHELQHFRNMTMGSTLLFCTISKILLLNLATTPL